MKLRCWVRAAAAIRSHPARGAWIEMRVDRTLVEVNESHPARGAWIEIVHVALLLQLCYVAPRKGCVD